MASTLGGVRALPLVSVWRPPHCPGGPRGIDLRGWGCRADPQGAPTSHFYLHLGTSSHHRQGWGATCRPQVLCLSSKLHLF